MDVDGAPKVRFILTIVEEPKEIAFEAYYPTGILFFPYSLSM